MGLYQWGRTSILVVTDVVVVHFSFFGSPYANKDLDIYCLHNLKCGNEIQSPDILMPIT